MSKRVSHTPRPWKVIPSPHGREYKCVQIGRDETYTTLELEPADARLIAAAPDLLTAAKQALDVLDEMDDSDHEPFFRDVQRALRAAIARAEGRSDE